MYSGPGRIRLFKTVLKAMLNRLTLLKVQDISEESVGDVKRRAGTKRETVMEDFG